MAIMLGPTSNLEKSFRHDCFKPGRSWPKPFGWRMIVPMNLGALHQIMLFGLPCCKLSCLLHRQTADLPFVPGCAPPKGNWRTMPALNHACTQSSA
jgi:hypothetical protein